MDNPYRATRVALDHAQPTSAPRQRAGFPFALLARWVLSLAIVAYGTSRLIALAEAWDYLADRAIIDLASNPYIRLAADSCIALTGVLLWRRSKFVFIPLLGHVAIFLWFVFGFGPVPALPGAIYLMWAGQSGVLVFCVWLLTRGRLR
jgi:hypothetical protein